MGKPIGVADYQLIVPQEELKKVVADEVEAFGKELPLRIETESAQKKKNILMQQEKRDLNRIDNQEG